MLEEILMRLAKVAGDVVEMILNATSFGGTLF